jgi:formylglycine-generating enzyme required for sulfatase activity
METRFPPDRRPAARSPVAARRLFSAAVFLFAIFLPALTAATAQPAAGLAAQRETRAATCPIPPGEVRVPGGKFIMGMDSALPEESPQREAAVREFWMDRTEVTNAQFAAFVKATGYRTQAERGWAGNRRVPTELQRPGSVVFKAPTGSAARADSWWVFTPGANWRHPDGPRSSLKGRLQHPVVHVTYDDALAYARWAGRDLPTEAEWERAARYGKQPGAMLEPPRKADGTFAANTFQGNFPSGDTGKDGHAGTAPVGCYGADKLGLYDLLGNVWEWTRDDYRITGQPTDEPSRVLKGGSYLCSEHFCARYRPAARQPGTENLGTSHIGFRTVRRSTPR